MGIRDEFARDCLLQRGVKYKPEFVPQVAGREAKTDRFAPRLRDSRYFKRHCLEASPHPDCVNYSH